RASQEEGGEPTEAAGGYPAKPPIDTASLYVLRPFRLGVVVTVVVVLLLLCRATC
ncbi:hypothetical protein K0M31_013739, partial [Melipona bicolor]